ncbi:F0F1-type ATP synthase assembly protein I [Desulfitispora alkaliphila]|uniref:AtpZ/AtpI family protein n=1 Tax=Desulfitispora alkaliphila TaxID=622674 RepID=UPI003D1A0DC8
MSGKSQWMVLRFIHMGFSFGITFAVLSFMGYLGGNYLDQRLGTAPVFLILGIMAGGGLAFYSLIKEILLYDKINRDDVK